MSTLLLSCVCDSIAAKWCEKAIMQMNEKEAGWADVEITRLITCSLVKIAAICVCGFLLWKLIEYISKGVAEYYHRRCDVNDRYWKQKSELTNKILDFQKEIAFPYDKDIDGKFEKKSYETKEKDEYLKTLSSLLKITLPDES